MKLYYDVIVVGGGHAGCEAAHAAAMMGAKTCLVTMDMNKIAQMSCNPAVGGIAKGQIVREVDALGGGMGIVTDMTAIQFRMLNKSKGPAMWSPRAQCDRGKFIWQWRTMLDNTPNLDIWQDQVEELISEELKVKSEESHAVNSSSEGNSNSSLSNHRVVGVKTIWGCEIYAPAVVITAGTFLNGLMHIGRKMVPGGRCAEPAALHLTESINALGITSQRMKTGTPVRIDKRSVHFEDATIQPGEDVSSIFSYMAGKAAATSDPTASLVSSDSVAAKAKEDAKATAAPALSQLPCWTFDTTPECHEILNSGLADSPLYNGQIQSIGPRYCPSIETKLVTFPDRTHHPLFLEPEGTDTNEMYLNGFSSSLPMDVQLEALKKIPALRDVKIYRPGYAIEYDFFDPTQLNHSLESKLCSGLFFAGQVNGTTGYEEAAGQGLMAGINAALYAGHLGASGNMSNESMDFNPFILRRDEAYIGVLIDDLVTKGVDEPYRMFTSRAEYRILLRQDNADARLTEKSHNIGLASTLRYNVWKEKEQRINDIIEFCRNAKVKPAQINDELEKIGSTTLNGSTRLYDLLSRPGISMEWLINHVHYMKKAITYSTERDREIADATETLIKYSGYIERERNEADKMHRLEDIRIRGHFDYNDIQSLSTEARQKLTRINPETLAQASRIPGVSPSDINVLLVLMGR
ncbi:MAG: tRNA uridine-5-carboxymethylaminomethyl(34) synthesis enzyme MnmG [Prevotella sp.]|nr:tRNA uridine-5-carboxymethylaminomethyl(34) synthesis enzyme MnmG [Prevotella sp.]